ncbi:MAG: hypothetical protein IPH31_20255 [Lewinellaceae bacterium]|nr:hypothetical protein [Lewinellaceae bacterium]
MRTVPLFKTNRAPYVLGWSRVNQPLLLGPELLTIATIKTTLNMNKKDLFKNMPQMSPLTERMEASKEKGFTENFEIISATTMINYGNDKEYASGDVSIVNHYRFEGLSDPGDNNILYELKTSDGKQGLLNTPYGPDCPAHVAEFVANIPQIGKQHGDKSPDTKHAETPLDVTISSNTTSSD